MLYYAVGRAAACGGDGRYIDTHAAMVTRSTNIRFPITGTNNSSSVESQPSTTARYRSEMFVPVVDSSSSSSSSGVNSAGLSSPPSSSSTSSSSWQTMHQRLDERRKQWNDEVSISILMSMRCVFKKSYIYFIPSLVSV